MHIHEGAWVVDRVQTLVDWNLKGQKRSTSSSLRFQLILVLEHFRLIFITETKLGVFTTGKLSLLLLLLLPANSCVFLHSFVPLRSLITETCSRASIVPRLRSQNGLGQKQLLLCQESRASFSFSRDPHPPPYLLTLGVRVAGCMVSSWTFFWLVGGNRVMFWKS